MLGTLLASIFVMAVLVFWYSGRAAAETAVLIGQRACSRAGVQWLDQSVHLLAIRLRRGPDGWLGLERHYGFEYSTGGDDRHAGRIVMHGRRLTALAGPVPPASQDGTT